jgi:hypothetical protein
MPTSIVVPDAEKINGIKKEHTSEEHTSMNI